MARLKVKYTEEVAPALFKKFGYKSTMQIPKIDKVVVNVGCGEARENAKVLDAVCSDPVSYTHLSGSRSSPTSPSPRSRPRPVWVPVRVPPSIGSVSYTHLTHKRLIDITNSTPKTVEALMALDLPAGVEIEIKL